jgi:Bifunctional DNA primase/polymerase, N-terminal
MTADPLARAAIVYAERLGWAVLPCRGKRPLTWHGVHDASRDIETIARWREHPDANVGVACGATSGIDVVDVDGEAGRATLAEVEAACGPLPATPRQVTGSGGLHVIFAYDPARPIGNRVRGLPGIDTRSDGGYVVVSPSIHPNGRRYRWDPDLHPLKVRPAAMPRWLAQPLMPAVDPSPVGQARPSIEEEAGWGPKPRYARAALQRACEAIEAAPIGQQDQTLNREAYSIGRLIGAGLMPRQLAIDCLVYHAKLMSNAPGRRPWREYEIIRKVAAAVHAGEQHPRAVSA